MKLSSMTFSSVFVERESLSSDFSSVAAGLGASTGAAEAPNFFMLKFMLNFFEKRVLLFLCVVAVSSAGDCGTFSGAESEPSAEPWDLPLVTGVDEK